MVLGVIRVILWLTLFMTVGLIQSRKLSLCMTAVAVVNTQQRNKCKNKCFNPICQPTVLINAKEQEFLKYVQVVSEWGCPFDYTDLRLLVNIYQSNLGRTVRHLT